MSDTIPRASSLQAMKSLLGSYTDHDDDEHQEMELETTDNHHDINNISGSEDEIDLEKRKTPASVKRPGNDSSNSTPVKVPKLEKRITKLVSYGGDDLNDEGDESDEEPDSPGSPALASYALNESPTHNSLSRNAHMSGDEVELPPSPTGKCSRSLQEKVTQMYEKKRRVNGINVSIQKKKEFRNPSIYEKLIDFCGIDEKGTNYPPHLYNPLIWGKESLYDALAKTQKEEMDRREKEKKDRTKVEFVVATKKSSSSSDLGSKSSQSNVKQERKSKWDSDKGSSKTSSNNKPTTVISAVGTLKKHK